MKKISLNAKRRVDAIHDEIRNRICFLEYPPGTRLKEGELAEEFRVSRTPIRQVFATLEAHGYVEARHGVGNIVTEINPEEIREIYEVRREIAILISKLSPISDVSGILTEIEPLIELCRPLCERPDVREFAKIDARFFLALCELTGNSALREVAETLYFRSSRIWVHSIPERFLGQEIRSFLSEMTQIHAALLHGDIDAVGHIRWLHISIGFLFHPDGNSSPNRMSSPEKGRSEFVKS